MGNLNKTEFAVGYGNVIETINTGEVKPLDDINHVESAIAMVADWQDQLDQLKSLKKLRSNQIDIKVRSLKDNIDFMKTVILKTLLEAGKKTVRFPGVGKVTNRKQKGKWEIDDEESLLKDLQDREEYKKVVQLKPVINKKELNKLLDSWEKIDKLPKGVKKTEDKASLSLSLEEDAKNMLEESLDIEDSVPQKKNIKDLDFSR